MKLKLPVTGTVGLTTVVLVSAFVFKLPEDYFTIGRSYKNSAADERAFLYSNIESMLDGLDQLRIFFVASKPRPRAIQRKKTLTLLCPN